MIVWTWYNNRESNPNIMNENNYDTGLGFELPKDDLDFCKNCNNRPTANEPFKVCHCTLGLPKVIC